MKQLIYDYLQENPPGLDFARDKPFIRRRQTYIPLWHLTQWLDDRGCLTNRPKGMQRQVYVRRFFDTAHFNNGSTMLSCVVLPLVDLSLVDDYHIKGKAPATQGRGPVNKPVCVQCGGEPYSNDLCKRCYRSTLAKDKWARHRAAGLCGKCSKPEYRAGLCKEHWERAQEGNKARRHRYHQQEKERRGKLGLCLYCPKGKEQPARPGTTLCQTHSEYYSNRGKKK